MPVYAPHENPKFFLRPYGAYADRAFVWIERIISESAEGPETTDLHKRLTVISSADEQRRRSAFNHVRAALAVSVGSTMEVHTEYGDAVSVHRTTEGTAMFDTRTKLPIHDDDRSLGIVGWLNNPQQMQAHKNLFHVNAAILRSRVQEDADLIHLAQTPLDQLFTLADKITTSERGVTEANNERADLNESRAERSARENSLHEQLEAERAGRKQASIFTYAALGFILAGVGVALTVALPIGVGICGIGVVIALIGMAKARASSGSETTAAAMDMQLDRLDELFDTQSLTRNRRTAEGGLAESREQWRAIAGEAEPSVLLKDRPRIEELSRHLQLITNAQVSEPGDTSILVGLASLLAELTRRFPSERVPLLIDDIFPEVPSQYHALTRELIMRASHKNQVLLETSDLNATKWAAVEAVGSNALLVTDYDIDTESIIANAVAPDSAPTV